MIETAQKISTKHKWEVAFKDAAFKEAFIKQVLGTYLMKCRWFAAKNARIKRYEVRSELRYTANKETVYLLIIEAIMQTAYTESYFLPVLFTSEKEGIPSKGILGEFTINGKDGFIIDALYSSVFRDSLFQNIMNKAEKRIGNGYLKFKRGRGIPKIEAVSSKLLNADQSNTTIVYNDLYFLKIYRKLFRDTNPDFEISHFFSDQDAFKNTPVFAGAITWKREDFYDVSLGLMQQKVENEGEAWAYFLKRADRFFTKIQERKIKAIDLPKVPLYKACKIEKIPLILLDLIGINTFEQVAKLAKRTCEMHLALFSNKTNRSFSPTNFSSDYQVWLLNRLMYQLDNRINLLDLNYDKLKGKSKEYADIFIENNEIIKNRILNFDVQRLNSKRIRIHGDFHLGQILVKDEDFYILDFEGEPESTIRDRKVKQPPIKDVAGLFRSFHYAVFATIFTNESKYQLTQDELFEAGGRYYRAIVAAFLNTYLETAFENGLDIGYYKEIDFLLRYHIFEKAIYELGYELNSRPNWVVIPLKGIMQILNND